MLCHMLTPSHSSNWQGWNRGGQKCSTCYNTVIHSRVDLVFTVSCGSDEVLHHMGTWGGEAKRWPAITPLHTGVVDTAGCASTSFICPSFPSHHNLHLYPLSPQLSTPPPHTLVLAQPLYGHWAKGREREAALVRLPPVLMLPISPLRVCAFPERGGGGKEKAHCTGGAESAFSLDSAHTTEQRDAARDHQAKGNISNTETQNN